MADPHDLARRAVACGWRWEDGARGTLPDGSDLRIGTHWTREPDEPPHTYIVDGDVLRDCDGRWVEDGGPDALPNFDDPATAALVPGQVREAIGEPEAFAVREGSGWYVWANLRAMYDLTARPLSGPCASRLEAWVVAWEGARR